MITGFITAFGVVWWILTVSACIALTAVSRFEDDWFFAGSLTAIAWAAVVTLFGTFNVLGMFAAMTLPALIVKVGTYLGIGFCWSGFKWFNRLLKAKERWAEIDEYFNNNFLPELKNRGKSEEEIEIEKLQYRYGDHKKSFELTNSYGNANNVPKFNVSEIAYWVVFWPFSALEFALYDMIKWIVTNVIKKIYKLIFDVVLSSHKKDFAKLRELETKVKQGKFQK